MQPIGMVLCKNTIDDLFRVLEREGLGFLKNEDELGLLYRVFPQKTLEWALNGDFRQQIVELLRRFSSFANTSIGLFYTSSLRMCAMINFVLVGKQGIYLLPVAELASDADTLFVPMNMTKFTSGEAVEKGTQVRVQYETLPGPEGEMRVCFIWLDGKFIRNLDS